MKAVADELDDTTIHFCVFLALELMALARRSVSIPEYCQRTESVFQVLRDKTKTQSRGSQLLHFNYEMRVALYRPDTLSDEERIAQAIDSEKHLKRINRYRSRVLGEKSSLTLLVKREIISAWWRRRKRIGRSALQEIVSVHEAELGRDHVETIESLIGLFAMKVDTGDVDGLPAMLDDALNCHRNNSARQERFTQSVFFERQFANAISKRYPVKVGEDLQMRALEIFCDIETAIAANPPSPILDKLLSAVETDLAELRSKSDSLRPLRDRVQLEIHESAKNKDYEQKRRNWRICVRSCSC